MKIGVAKIGKSIKFKEKNWGGAGGDCEVPKIISMLSKHNPDVEYYVIGKNDMKTLTDEENEKYFPNKNVFNASDFNLKTDEDYDEALKQLHELKLDGIVMMTGTMGSTNIPNFRKDKNKKYYLKVLDVFRNYAGYLIRFMNETTIPITWLCVDPRYVPNMRDLLADRYPKSILSQFDTKVKSHTIGTLEDAENYKTVNLKFDLTYDGIECIFLYGYKKFDVNKIDEAFKEKENKFSIVLNQGLGAGGDDRYKELVNYIGKWGSDKCIENVEIYGNWDEKIMEKDPRFKGTRKYEELKELMKSVKATLIIPIKKGWVTSKYVETMNGWDETGESMGMITFFSKTYDSQCHVLPKDHFLRVTPQDFKAKLAKILTDDEFCKQLYREQYELLTDEMYSGEYISNVIMTDMKKKIKGK